MSIQPHCRDLLELAAIVLERAPMLVECDGLMSTDQLAACWTAAAARNSQWSAELRLLEEAPSLHRAAEASALIAELAAAEPLSRVFAAVVAARQQRQQLRSVTAVFRGSLNDELAARNRGTGLLLRGRLLPMEQALRLHRLRRTTERICDAMIGALATRYEVADYACRTERVEAALRRTASRHWSATAAVAGFPARWLASTLSLPLPAQSKSSAVLEAVLACLPPPLLWGHDAPLSARRLGLLRCGDQFAERPPWEEEPPRRPRLVPRTWPRFS